MFFVGEKFKSIKIAYLVDCGNYYHTKKNIGKAIKYYQKALRADSEDYYANIGLAGALVMNKSFRESLDFFKKANSLQKPEILTLILMFVVYKALDEENRQKEILKEIKKIFANHEITVNDRIANTFFELGMYDEAEYYIRKTLRNYPNEAGLYYNLGKTYFAQGKFGEARDKFQKTLKLAREKGEKPLKKYALYYLKRVDGRKEKKGKIGIRP
jgi:tetratricopeptide (TPR) repeat protein